MTIWLHRCMIVPSAWAKTVHDLCDKMAPDGSGSNMFLVELSASGALPATHFISAGAQGAEFCALMPLTTFDATDTAATRPGQPATIVYLAGQAGITVSRAQVDAMLAAVEVTQEHWQDALIRRGLQTIQGALP